MSAGGAADIAKSELLAMFNSAVDLHRRGHLDRAIDAYRTLLKRLPDHPDVTDLLGTALFQIGDPGHGRGYVRRSLAKRPLSAASWNHLGAIERALLDNVPATQAFQRALAIEPGAVEAYVNLAALAGDGGDFDRGLALNGRALAIAAASADAGLRQGVLLAQAERHGEARPWLRCSWRRHPGNAEIALHLARALAAEGEHEAAGRVTMAGLAVSPASFELIGTLTLAAGHAPANAPVIGAANGAAGVWPCRAIALRPLDSRGWGNLSAELYRDGRLEIAAVAARRSVLLDPANAGGLRNLSSATVNLHRFELCRRVTIWTTLIAPQDANAQYVLAELEFRVGDLQTAWRMHEIRFRRDQFRPRLNVPEPWRGPGTEQGPLLVASEQGIGDEVIFLSCLPEFIARIEVPIVIEVDRRLVPLMQRSFPNAIVVPRQLVPGDGLGQFFDYAALARRHGVRHVVFQGSLPLFLDRSRDRPLQRVGYLKPDPDRLEFWRNWLRSLAGGCKVGVMWRTAQMTPFRARIHCTIDEFMPVLRIPNVGFINLMVGDEDAEHARIRDEVGLELVRPPGLDLWEDIDGLVALMAALDIVVAARTANYAFAAAVGVPTIRLAQSFMHISEHRDFFFPNALPILDRLAPFDGRIAGRNAAAALSRMMPPA